MGLLQRLSRPSLAICRAAGRTVASSSARPSSKSKPDATANATANATSATITTTNTNTSSSSSSSTAAAAAHSHEPPARKRPRASAIQKTSLRSVAAEAQHARAWVRSRGRTRFIDPDVETKTVTAYCAAETYDMAVAARLVASHGYAIDPCHTRLYPQLLHVQTKANAPHYGDLFIFASGTVVAWNVGEPEALELVRNVLPPAAEGSHLHLLETEDLDYLEDPTTDTSQLVGDTIVLGTKHTEPSSFSSSNSPPVNLLSLDPSEVILAKIAFSSGLARSTKLAVLETLLSNYQHSTRDIPTMLAANQTVTATLTRRRHALFTRSFILRKTGELLSIRAQLNLYSELTDSMPDIFWDSRLELGLGDYYDQVGRALDVGVRIKLLNDKIGFAQEIAAVLREQLSEKHGLRLEWAIIALIAVEVVLECYRHWTDRAERDDPASTEALLREHLFCLKRSHEGDEDEREKGKAKGT